jgi:hypothetical protein
LSFPSIQSSSTATDPDEPPPAARPASEQRLAGAQKRLQAALEGLDAALSLQAERVQESADESAEFAALQEDRSRLAQELGAATARLRAFEAANGEALARVERASAAVRAVLAADSTAASCAEFSRET